MLFRAFVVFLYIYTFTGMIVVAVLLGVFRTFINVPVSLIYAEHLPTERCLWLLCAIHLKSLEIDNSLDIINRKRIVAFFPS